MNSGILNFITVFASLITCIFSFCSVKAAWAQVREMRRQYQEDNRPNIEVEFLYERRAFYGLRFINHGKCTAQNVKIVLDATFINSLPEPVFSNYCEKLNQKTCVIGVGQHYDLYIGSNNKYKTIRTKNQQREELHIKQMVKHMKVFLILILKIMQ